MIVVTGANGQLGSAVVEQLLQRMPAAQIGVSVREPAKAQALADRGVRVRADDFRDPAHLKHAFEGASQVLVISSNSSGIEAVQHHKNAIEAAKTAGAQRVLYTSHMAASPTSAFGPMPDHAATEAYLQQAGIAYTSLRNGFYASTPLFIMGPALQTGKLVAPEDGPVSWTAHADLAEVTALVLHEPGKLDGLSPGLTGAEALTMTDIAALASDLTGRKIERVTISDAEYRASLLAHGFPAERADMFVGLFAAMRAGEFKTVDPTLARLLGKKPVSMREVLAKKIAS